MTTNDEAKTPNRRKWNIGLWVAQVLLAAVFLMAGFTKLTSSPQDMVAMGMLWAENSPISLIRFIGITEVLGAIGILLPAATRIKPDLTKLAALGLAIVMVLAFGLHAFRGEFEVLPVNVILFALAMLVFWGRTKKASINARV